MRNVETTENVYTFIETYWREYHLSPTQREIAEGCFISKSAVIRHLDRLEAQGRIERILNIARSISIVDSSAK